MKKTRIFKIAKELNIASEKIINFLKGKKYPIKGINSPVDGETYEEIMEYFHSDKLQADKRQAAKSMKDGSGGTTATATSVATKRVINVDVRDLNVKEESIFNIDIFIGGETYEMVKEKEEIAAKAAYEIKRKAAEKLAAEKKAEMDRLEEIKEASAALKKRKMKQTDKSTTTINVVSAEKEEDVKVDIAIVQKDQEAGAVKEDATAESDKEKKKIADSKAAREAREAKERKKKKRKLSDKGRDVAEKAKEIKKVKFEPSEEEDDSKPKKKRRRKRDKKKKVDEQEVQASIKETLAKMGESQKLKKYKKKIREEEDVEEETNVLKVTEFISANELAGLMDVEVSEVIKKSLGIGILISINQRLDLDTISMVADEFGFEIEQVDETEIEEFGFEEEEEDEASLIPRPPIVTVMGHVDHGKTSLLDYIRKENVVAGEAGGITQHIGAYSVKLRNKTITFLDTPGHEAFTAMRARGAQLTDIVILVVAADDSVMPQTIEAIDHSQAANVPIVIAINKIDKPGADPEKIKKELNTRGILVEEWGGKHQSVELSAKTGQGVKDLLELVALEAEVLELKANPDRLARGVVVETKLEKGRGSVVTVLVQKGTLKIGDIFVCGQFSGRVRAMFNERQKNVKEVLPSVPVQVTGFTGLPQAGDEFVVVETEKMAKEISIKRQQIKREQQFRQARLVTLDEISKQIKHGKIETFNLIIKGDVDGSVEALSDSLMKLSNDKVKVNIIHKAVGGITESNVLLASASRAVILGFQVRPTVQARIVAEREKIDIRGYSVIYDAVNDVKTVLEGMLPPEIKEEILGLLEVREVFRITKVGNIAGCMAVSGKIHRNDKIRLIRQGTVVFNGKIDSLKRFKEDVRDVASGFECGLGIENYNDLKVGDNIEAYKITEEKQKLK